MSALDTEIEVSPSIPWGPAWLDRTLPSLFLGAHYTHQTLVLSIVLLSVVMMFRNRGLRKELRENPSDGPRLSKLIDERVVKFSRANFLIINIYLLGTFLIAGVDAYISFVSLKNDVRDHSEIWTRTFVLELAGLTAGLLVLFTAVFIIVPFVQVCLSFWLLTRFVRKRGQNTLGSYIPVARAVSLGIAQLWATSCFLLQAWTSPTDAGIWRWILLQAAVGSAIAWLDASFAFVFCADRLKDREIELSTAGVKEVVALFGRTILEVHAKGERDALLPKYEVVQQDTVYVDEKAGA